MNTRFLTFIISGALQVVIASELIADSKASREVSERSRRAVWNRLRPIVQSSGKPVRIYYGTRCNSDFDSPNTDHPVPFPFTRVDPAFGQSTGVAAIRSIFRRDKNVEVTEDAGGIIRIWIGVAPQGILKTRLSKLKLDSTAQYNPDVAFGSIIDTPEMDRAMHALRFANPPTLGGTIAEPLQGLPHLPPTLQAMTVEQALDEIAKTWAGEGIVVYGACLNRATANSPSLFSLEYLGDLLPK